MPLPPGPRSALSQLFHMNDPLPLLVDLGRTHGDPFTCPILGAEPMVLTWGPEGARTIFSADPATFAPGTSEALSVIVGKGSLFLASGDAHKRARKLLMPPFHGERMKAYSALMCSAARRWAATLRAGTSGPILPTAQGITLDVIIEAIFGARDQAEIDQLHGEILGLVAAFNPLIATFRFLQRDFGGLGPWAKFQKSAGALKQHMLQLIERKKITPGEDILSLLLAARDEEGGSLSSEEIIDQLLTFVVAGHETTSTSLAWALYELLRAPASLDRLQTDLASLGPDPSPEALARLPFLEAVCNETLRLHPPVPIVPRKLSRPLTLCGHDLPAGTTVGVALYLAHMREETFSDPLSFRPERFIERTFTPFELMPFGGGARRCLGAAFAMHEMKLVLGTLLAARRFRLDEPKPVKNAFRIGTYGPATGVRVSLVS